MNDNRVMKKNGHFYLSIILNILEGMLSGCNYIVLYNCIKSLWENNLSLNMIFKLTAILLLVFIIRLIIYSIGYTQGQIGGVTVSKTIRLFMGDKIKKIPLSKLSKEKTGTYINVVTNDINNYEKILTHKVGDIVKNITLSAMLIIFISTIYLQASIVILVAELTLIPTLWYSFRSVKKYGNKKNSIMTNTVTNIVEYITGIQTLRSYGNSGTKNKTVTQSMKQYSDISFVYESRVIPIGMIFSVISWSSLPIMLLVAGHGFFAGILEAPTFFMLSILPIFASKLAGVIFVDLTSYKNLMISKKRIKNVINEKEQLTSTKEFSLKSHKIEFNNVMFSYEKGTPILKNIHLLAEDEKFTAIVGDSGSGKSTILNLISKYYESQAGEIKIGNISINNINAEKVLDHISMVDQEVFLFNDTIKNNIKYARPSATDEEVINACKLANCDEFIKKLEKGYDAIVGENGNRFSGGERQRLSIARAILKDSPIVLLDEATASLDIENELAVKEAINNLLKKKKTVIMIAHTLSIIKNADTILVISNGKIKERGTHEELIKRHGKYFNMWQAEKKLLSFTSNNKCSIIE